jgi:hypothetical protein
MTKYRITVFASFLIDANSLEEAETKWDEATSLLDLGQLSRYNLEVDAFETESIDPADEGF